MNETTLLIKLAIIALGFLSVTIVCIALIAGFNIAARDSRRYSEAYKRVHKSEPKRVDILSRILYILTTLFMVALPLNQLILILHDYGGYSNITTPEVFIEVLEISIIMLIGTPLCIAPILVMLIASFMACRMREHRTSTHLIAWAGCIFSIVINYNFSQYIYAIYAISYDSYNSVILDLATYWCAACSAYALVKFFSSINSSK